MWLGRPWLHVCYALQSLGIKTVKINNVILIAGKPQVLQITLMMAQFQWRVQANLLYIRALELAHLNGKQPLLMLLIASVVFLLWHVKTSMGLAELASAETQKMCWHPQKLRQHLNHLPRGSTFVWVKERTGTHSQQTVGVNKGSRHIFNGLSWQWLLPYLTPVTTTYKTLPPNCTVTEDHPTQSRTSNQWGRG